MAVVKDLSLTSFTSRYASNQSIRDLLLWMTSASTSCHLTCGWFFILKIMTYYLPQAQQGASGFLNLNSIRTEQPIAFLTKWLEFFWQFKRVMGGVILQSTGCSINLPRCAGVSLAKYVLNTKWILRSPTIPSFALTRDSYCQLVHVSHDVLLVHILVNFDR